MSTKLNLNHLVYFHAVAEEGSLSAASRKLGVSQGTMSEQIRQLESTLKRQLFIRAPAGLQLNEAGLFTFEQTHQIIEAAQRIEHHFLPRESAVPPLRIGLASAVSRDRASELLLPLLEFEGVLVRVVLGEGQNLLSMLLSGELDLVLSDRRVTETQRTGSVEVSLEGPRLVVLAHRELVKEGTPEELKELPFVQFTPGSRFRWEVERYFEQRELFPRIVAEVDDIGLLLAAARRKLGAIVVPESSVEIARYPELRRVDRVTEAGMDLYLTYLSSEPTELVQRAIEVLSTEAKRTAEAKNTGD